MTTSREKYQEATNKLWEMVAHKEQLEEQARALRVVYNEVENEGTLERLDLEEQQELGAVREREESQFRAAEASAGAILEQAQRDYESAVKEAQQRLYQAVEEAETRIQERNQARREEYQERLGVARIEAHEAEKQVEQVKAEIDRYCKIVQGDIGLNLKALLD